MVNVLSQYPIPDRLGELARAALQIDGALDAGSVFHGLDSRVQIGLHSIAQTDLPATTAKSFAVKKTLADQVQEFMLANTNRRGRALSAGDMARLVAAKQTDLPERERCKRQNIESLLAKNSSYIHYLTALAAAMGTTAEVLTAGRWTAAGVAKEVPPPAKRNGRVGVDDDTSTSSERITRYVSDVSQSLAEFARILNKPQRTQLRGLMGDLLSNPEAFAHLDRDRVRALLSDNTFRDDPEIRTEDLSDPFTDIDSHSVTNEDETNHGTDRDGPTFSISTKRRTPRAG